jgi:hypothetical protein
MASLLSSPDRRRLIFRVRRLRELTMANIVQIKIYADPNSPDPTMSLPDVPWYAGITALQAMIIGEAMHPSNFSFRVVYRSIFGAFVDSIDGVTDGDMANHFWLLAIDGLDAQVGASEAIIREDATRTAAVVEWRFKNISGLQPRQVDLKAKAL